MKITVIGCGRWGSLIAWYLDSIKQEVTLYGRKSSKHMQRFMIERKNDVISLPASIKLSNDLDVINEAEIVIISVNSQGFQALMDELKKYKPKNKVFVLCMKGIEIATERRLSQVAKDNLDESNKVAVWLGPGHVQELANGIPNCMVIDSDDEEAKKLLVDAFSSELIRFYYGQDLIGNELGAATKNVIGIAAGMLDGLKLSSLKGALMSRGTREVARLIKAMGGNELSAYGLCHLGDYEATVFSKYSHNRQFGESFIKNEEYDELAEGCYTVKAVLSLATKNKVDMPICHAVYQILYKDKDALEVLNGLFIRELKNEF
ncbi:MAG: NAD(P)H-dependent glycerol-3-phosphate dehydrogenase [Erysipelotrichaceae bacterium]|nr:NAD(P)H-dependent glycerol-3-phosphate dehydrogenase [Erysipelotrichaceae bacterium]